MRGVVLEVLGLALMHKTVDKKTEDVTLACEGFNQKNHSDRETPAIFCANWRGRLNRIDSMNGLIMRSPPV